MLKKNKITSLFVIFIVFFILILSFLSGFSGLTVNAANEWPTVNDGTTKMESHSNNGGSVKFDDDQVVNMDDLESKYTREEKAMLDNDYTQYYEDALPEVTIDDVLAWIYRKGYDIIRGLQVLAQPLTILAFISSAIMMLFGIFGRGDKLSKGITGMVISGFVYVAILYAPTILKAIVSFFTT